MLIELIGVDKKQEERYGFECKSYSLTNGTIEEYGLTNGVKFGDNPTKVMQIIDYTGGLKNIFFEQGIYNVYVTNNEGKTVNKF